MQATITRRAQLATMTGGTWPHADLMAAVDVLADELHDRCGVPRVAVTATVHVLYAVAASTQDRAHARQQLLEWASMLDALNHDAESMDAYRRCGPSPV